jgi:AcrR family transcriptional regulator
MRGLAITPSTKSGGHTIGRTTPQTSSKNYVAVVRQCTAAPGNPGPEAAAAPAAPALFLPRATASGCPPGALTVRHSSAKVYSETGIVFQYKRGSRVPATRDEIALTFMGLAFRYGARRAAVADVARALRISKKTIYEVFPSKEAMLEYGLELAALEQRRSVEARLTQTTALGRALEMVRLALADARAGFGADRAGTVGDSDLRESVNDRVYGSMLRDLLQAGVAAGAFRIEDVEMTGRFVQAVGREAVRQIHDQPESRPEEAAVEAVRRLIVGGSREAAVGADRSVRIAAGPGQAARSPGPAKKRKKRKKK